MGRLKLNSTEGGQEKQHEAKLAIERYISESGSDLVNYPIWIGTGKENLCNDGERDRDGRHRKLIQAENCKLFS